MSRFQYTGETAHRPVLRFAGVVLVIAVMVLFFIAVRHFGSYSSGKQLESLENALRRDIIQCYAIEGIYPPDLSYLKDHYGLTYDEKRFYIDYRPAAGNLYPDVTILETKGR